MQERETLWEDPALINHLLNRATTAFEFVRGKSILASKVLEFGMEQLRLMAAKSENMMMQQCDR
jgi:hypothetical protein